MIPPPARPGCWLLAAAFVMCVLDGRGAEDAPPAEPRANRLAAEKSPYLLQHAHNPVDWRPWGDEAFEAARREDKPVFLSIGYSTCHWCHVMERESFADPEVAALLNEGFICIKVDREERPDIDAVYMRVTVGMTGSGGWPMTVLLTPDRKPFFAGTYFPKEGKFGRPGLMELLPKITELWRDERAKLLSSAEEVHKVMVESARPTPAADAPGEAALESAFRALAGQFDDENGGFGIAPKFPTPHQLMFLLRWWRRSGDPRPLEMVEKTLGAMTRGGIFDHVGLGFHRYSTDPAWRVPHFEKMLYDQAMLMIACTEAYRATGRAEHARVVRAIFDYVSRVLTSPEGAFFCAEDADSEGEEGKFYLWSAEEFAAALGADDAALFGAVFNVRAGGNFHEEGTGHSTGRNILHMTKSWAEEAGTRKLKEQELLARWGHARAKLLAARERRPHPLLDDKVLADWNGLMIAALAAAGNTFDDAAMTAAARRAADFVLTRMRGEDGRLHHRWRGGEAGLPAHLEDYAFMAWGLIELYEAELDPRHLRAALGLTDKMIELFADAELGGFYMSETAEGLPARIREHYDGAVPSGNAVAAMNLLRLARMTGRTEFERSAEGVFRSVGADLRRSGPAHTMHLCALDFALGPSYEVILSGDAEGDDFRAMRSAIRTVFAPNMVLLHRPPGSPGTPPEICALAPFTLHNLPRDGKATAYVCQNFACHAPTTDPAAVIEALSPIRPAPGDESGDSPPAN